MAVQLGDQVGSTAFNIHPPYQLLSLSRPMPLYGYMSFLKSFDMAVRPNSMIPMP